MNDRKLEIYKLLARCMKGRLVTGLSVPSETWAQCLEENFTAPPLAEEGWIPVDLNNLPKLRALSELPPRRCYCGCQ